MFKETDDGQTQYCPMCEEWAEKYEQLKAENEELKSLLDFEVQQREVLGDKNAKQSLALEEIKKIAEHLYYHSITDPVLREKAIYQIIDNIKEVLK